MRNVKEERRRKNIGLMVPVLRSLVRVAYYVGVGGSLVEPCHIYAVDVQDITKKVQELAHQTSAPQALQEAFGLCANATAQEIALWTVGLGAATAGLGAVVGAIGDLVVGGRAAQAAEGAGALERTTEWEATATHGVPEARAGQTQAEAIQAAGKEYLLSPHEPGLNPATASIKGKLLLVDEEMDALLKRASANGGKLSDVDFQEVAHIDIAGLPVDALTLIRGFTNKMEEAYYAWQVANYPAVDTALQEAFVRGANYSHYNYAELEAAIKTGGTDEQILTRLRGTALGQNSRVTDEYLKYFLTQYRKAAPAGSLPSTPEVAAVTKNQALLARLGTGARTGAITGAAVGASTGAIVGLAQALKGQESPMDQCYASAAKAAGFVVNMSTNTGPRAGFLWIDNQTGKDLTVKIQWLGWTTTQDITVPARPLLASPQYAWALGTAALQYITVSQPGKADIKLYRKGFVVINEVIGAEIGVATGSGQLQAKQLRGVSI